MLYYNIELIWYTEMVKAKNKSSNPMLDILDKSIEELNINSKAIETALEKFLEQEGIDISSEEFNEVKRLTDTMNELDNTLLALTTKPAVKPKAKPKKKKRKRKK